MLNMRSSGYHANEKKIEKEKYSAIGRSFKLDIRNRFLMLLLFTIVFT